MINKEVCKSIIKTFNYSNADIEGIYTAGGSLNNDNIVDCMQMEDKEADIDITDEQLFMFLNGLINERRGKIKGVAPVEEKRISNNIIFKKLKIALDLKADDVQDILKLTDITISNHELSAIFRKPKHKHYRKCRDQTLLGFLHGIELKYADTKTDSEQ